MLHEKRIQDSLNYLAAKAEASEDAHRLRQFIQHRRGIPIEGAISLIQSDPEIQGPRLFTAHCASCHAHVDENGKGIAGPTEGVAAPNLFGFASRTWLAGVLNPETFASRDYFGATAHAEDLMNGYLNEHVAYLSEEGKQQLGQVIAALSAEAKLVGQAEADSKAEADGTLTTGRELIATALSATEDAESEYSCTDCHKFHDAGEYGAPDLTGYGSEEWLVELISNPDHERFYEGSNDRMPAFHADSKDPDNNRLSEQQVRMIAQWLRGDLKTLDVSAEQ